MEARKQLATRLFEIQAFKVGDFLLKSGLRSPVYFDLRVIVSYPDVMNLLADTIVEFLKSENLEFDHVCGVPYTALPIATLVSIKESKPMLMRRKEAKDYGTRKMIEGKYAANELCLIIEDVVTSGSSVLETVKDLKAEGLRVSDAIVVVDREQGGASAVSRHGVKMHSLFTLSSLLQILSQEGLIETSMVETIKTYIAGNQVTNGAPQKPQRTKLTFEERSGLSECVVAKRLFDLMASKRTNLCLAADLTTTSDILNVAQVAGPFICVLKLHVDVIEDFSQNFVNSLRAIANTHNFLIMEDRKFADIGNTVALQYSRGVFKICEWADLVTAHTLPGPSLLKSLKSCLTEASQDRGVFLLAELSSAGNLINAQYSSASIKMATEGTNLDVVAGVVCQNGSLLEKPGLIQLTPGVKLEEGGDDLGQQYNSPAFVVKEKGADMAVVGRGICEARSVAAAAETYRNALWNAYCERVGLSSAY